MRIFGANPSRIPEVRDHEKDWKNLLLDNINGVPAEESPKLLEVDSRYSYLSGHDEDDNVIVGEPGEEIELGMLTDEYYPQPAGLRGTCACLYGEWVLLLRGKVAGGKSDGTGEVFCEEPIPPDVLTDSPEQEAAAWIRSR